MLSKDQVENYRFQYGIGADPIAPKTNSTTKDLLIGAAKGLGDTARSLLDVGAIAPQIGGAPLVLKAMGQKPADVTEKIKTSIRDDLGLSDEVLRSDNTTQKVGKGLSFAAELFSPLVSSKVARLPALIRSITGREPLVPAMKAGSSVEDVVRTADARSNVQSTADAVMKGAADPSVLKSATDKAAVPVTFTEKLAGLAPDVKARIKGKGQLLADYLNITDARNASDLVPTPLEYGASFARQAGERMQELLSDSGSKIGAFRQKVATYQAPRESFNTLRQSFDNELGKLNLTIRGGQIVKVPGRIAQTVSDGEVTALQKLYDDLNIASQNPSLENLIDLRSKFDNKINFDKAAREASTSLDPLSRTVRKKIAELAANIVGKSEAATLEEYSNFMDALRDLTSYTDRNAGAEFLLKRVFSERGADPRAVMQTILQHTGIDLMDHAMMAKIATELGGNSATQGLFRQEITRAGLDVANLLKGNPTGAVDTLVSKGMDALIDKRKIFKRAAQ